MLRQRAERGLSSAIHIVVNRFGVSDDAKRRKPTLAQEIVSVLAAFFGVQSSKNRERDFSTGSPYRFVMLGIGFTLLFVLAVIGVVRLIVRQANL